LAYYDQQPDRKKEASVPNGVFFIHELRNIQTTKPKEFKFTYNNRVFEF